jgi:hypothetical protein
MMAAFLDALVILAVVTGPAAAVPAAAVSESSGIRPAQAAGLPWDSAGCLPGRPERRAAPNRASTTAATSADPNDGYWQEIPPPPPLSFHEAVYDPIQDQLVAFGGWMPGREGPGINLWTLPFATGIWREWWIQGLVPLMRHGHTLTYDPVRHRAILYGGWSGRAVLGDVWSLSLDGAPSWTEITPSSGAPRPLTEHAAVYAPAQDRLLVIGGWDGAQRRGDVSALPLSGDPAWRDVPVGGDGPAPRHSLSAVMDEAGRRVLVFAGSDSSSDGNDLWALDLDGGPRWERLQPNGPAPDPRRDATAIWAGDPRRMVVFGGQSDTTFADLYILDADGGGRWEAISPAGDRPTARHDAAAILDTRRNRTVLSGGFDRTTRSDLWAWPLDGPAEWTRLTPDLPPPRGGPTVIEDVPGDRLVIFGGGDGSDDAWSAAFGNLIEWTALPVIGPRPPGRSAHSAVFDSRRRRMIVFGGERLGTCLSDVWALTLGDTSGWTCLAPTTAASPPARAHAAAIYDPVGDRLIVHGGWRDSLSCGVHWDDVWALSLSDPPSWTRLQPIGSVPGHSAACATYDPVRHRMLLFAGVESPAFCAGSLSNRVWALSLGETPAWSELVPEGTPPSVRGLPVGVYDPTRDRVVYYGGYEENYLSDSWALELGGPAPTWRELHPAGGVAAMIAPGAVYDAGRDRMVVVGNSNYLRVLQWGETLDAPPAHPPYAIHVLPVSPNPACGAASLRFDLPAASGVRVAVFDLAGRRVRALADGVLPAGLHEARWDGAGPEGRRAPPGLYFFRALIGERAYVRRLVLLR